MFFNYPKEVDKSQFSSLNKDPKVLYGLPRQTKYCKKCTISNQRPCTSVEFKNSGKNPKDTISFGESNICDACKISELKANIDWDEREKNLREICNKFRREDGSYDCLVPGSGGKDSFMTAHMLKYK